MSVVSGWRRALLGPGSGGNQPLSYPWCSASGAHFIPILTAERIMYNPPTLYYQYQYRFNPKCMATNSFQLPPWNNGLLDLWHKPRTAFSKVFLWLPIVTSQGADFYNCVFEQVEQVDKKKRMDFFFFTENSLSSVKLLKYDCLKKNSEFGVNVHTSIYSIL